jgi:hypothetical protein
VDPLWNPPPIVVVPNQGPFRMAGHFQTNHLSQVFPAKRSHCNLKMLNHDDRIVLCQIDGSH